MILINSLIKIINIIIFHIKNFLNLFKKSKQIYIFNILYKNNYNITPLEYNLAAYPLK